MAKTEIHIVREKDHTKIAVIGNSGDVIKLLGETVSNISKNLNVPVEEIYSDMQNISRAHDFVKNLEQKVKSGEINEIGAMAFAVAYLKNIKKQFEEQANDE